MSAHGKRQVVGAAARRSRFLPALKFLGSLVVALGLSAMPISAAAEPKDTTPATWTLTALQDRHNAGLHTGILRLRSAEAPDPEWIAGDNTDPWGMMWTKCTNLGIQMLTSIVAEQRGVMDREDAKKQIRGVLDVLGRLKTHKGIFPENLTLKGGVAAEVVDGKTRFSSIDSAWVTLALSLVDVRYESDAPDIAEAARALIARQDYRVFVGPDGLLGAGFYVDVATDKKTRSIAFSYNDRNSEARPLVLALVGMGQLPASAWDKTVYEWGEREGFPIAKGWHFSAFVEMTGALFFDEAKLAPESLGKSHQNYLEATVSVARRAGHHVYGYAPACDAKNPYAEFGLDRPDAVSPYAAALLTLTGDPRALANFNQVLQGLPRNGSPLADGLDPRSGQVSCGVARTLDQGLMFLSLNEMKIRSGVRFFRVARTLDQGLMFLSLNADVLRGLVRGTSWYPSAAQRLQAMDGPFRAPAKPASEPKLDELPIASGPANPTPARDAAAPAITTGPSEATPTSATTDPLLANLATASAAR